MTWLLDSIPTFLNALDMNPKQHDLGYAAPRQDELKRYLNLTKRKASSKSPKCTKQSLSEKPILKNRKGFVMNTSSRN